jgi:putative membrane protein
MKSFGLMLITCAALAACRSYRTYGEENLSNRSNDPYDSSRSAAHPNGMGGWSDTADHARMSEAYEERSYGTDGAYSTGTTGQVREASAGTGDERAVAAADHDFVEKATQGGLFEVESSQLALQKNITDEHRDFARMMIDDHGKANRKLSEFAQQVGCPVPKEMNREQRADVDDLRRLDGQEFERRYHAMQVTAHDQAIELFERASRECEDKNLRAFANDTLPTLREHRRHLDQHPY